MDKLYEYRKPLVRGSADTYVVDGPIAWVDSYISKADFRPLFGGYLVTIDIADKRSDRYIGVWGKDKMRKFKRILRERGAKFEVCEIDGRSRWVHSTMSGSRGRAYLRGDDEATLTPVCDNLREIELIRAIESDGQYFAVIGVAESGVTGKFRFGVYETGYAALRRILQTRLSDAMPGVAHRYFFSNGKTNPCTIAVRIQTQSSAQQSDFRVPIELLRNLVWWSQLHDLSEGAHLAELDDCPQTKT